MDNFTITIRPINIEDTTEVNTLKTMDGVRENTLGLFSESIHHTENWIQGLSEHDFIFVAEINENGKKKIVGLAGLHVSKHMRTRHSGWFGIMVAHGYQGRGIGKKLISKILDLADNWLMLVRIELNVFVDNEDAKKLYESFGFQLEGIKKYSAIRQGVYADEYFMARYRL